ncbi:hypothetical protein KJ359_012074 [Pestalotiopsis sp. 9143b]|nr:hypothetical protein KJ359_012074 [Pestalotiopsis sp. 9143b]
MVIPTLSGGGLFMHEHATRDEVYDVAHTMSAKLAVSSQPQIVGAKGGIRFKHGDSRAAGVLRRFIRDNSTVISQYWATGGDLNTSHETIDEHCRSFCVEGTKTALDVLLRNLTYSPSAEIDVEGLLQEEIDGLGWSVRDFSVGYVMAKTLQQLLVRTNPSLVGHARLVLQGFGCVGATFAQAVQSLGIGRIVVVSSQYGFLANEHGIDCNAIHAFRRKTEQTGSHCQFDLNSLEAGLTEAVMQSDLYTQRRAGSTDEEHLIDCLSAGQANVFVPCAQRYVMTPKVTTALVEKTFAGVIPDSRFVLAGANNIFHPGKPTELYLSQFDSGFVKMLPEWVSNSGTSNLFMRACSELALGGRPVSNLESCAKDTTAFINSVFQKAQDHATSTLWNVSETISKERRKTGASNLLGVDELVHLTLGASDVQRSKETFEKVCGATSVQDNGRFVLPGPGDPTVEIFETPDVLQDPTAHGLTMHFSVCNLNKTRQVLVARAIGFCEEPARDGSSELVFTGGEAGYRVKLCQAPKLAWPVCGPRTTMKLTASISGVVRQLDHYTPIVANAHVVKEFHERFMGFNFLRTMSLNIGSAPEGGQDAVLHILGLPFDDQRTMVLTQALLPECVFAKMLDKKGHPFVHHVAMEIEDVDAAFSAVRDAGWATAGESISLDLASGLRQFFLREEEAGCVVELVQRVHQGGRLRVPRVPEATELIINGDNSRQQVISEDAGAGVKISHTQGQFQEGNIISLANGLISYL